MVLINRHHVRDPLHDHHALSAALVVAPSAAVRGLAATVCVLEIRQQQEKGQFQWFQCPGARS